MPTDSVYSPVQKDRATFVTTARASAGAVTVIDIELAPGGGNFLHYHTAFTERFEVQQGQLGVRIEGRTLRLGPGESAFVQKRERHRFFNGTGDVTLFRAELKPGSPGFESALRIAYGLAADGRTNRKGIPHSVLDLAILTSMAETFPTGPAGLIARLLGRLAATRTAERRRAELMARYCPP
jgi:mannose-6-phosphate isomerase-like protein (cupin superfamily)